MGDSFNAVVSGRHGVEGHFQSGHFCVLGRAGPDVATAFVGALARATTSLTGVCGFEPPTWQALIEGTRPSPVEPEALDWQHVVSSKVEHEHREVVFGRLRPSARAQVRSQGGPGAGLALSATPTHFLTRIPSHLFSSRDVATSSTPTASVVAHMPVWPPNRQIWPPPSIVCTRGRVGAEGVRFGKCDSPSVPRSRRESHPECHGA